MLRILSGQRLPGFALLLAALSISCHPVGAQQAAADDDKAHFELMPYMVLAAMGGDLTVDAVPLPSRKAPVTC
jgi:hypothetical protein